ncbi:MAG: sensor histidine kinase [Mycolicibacterium sp.]|nr:sensor histidine kinase [Mycolicibacterium sp.]
MTAVRELTDFLTAQPVRAAAVLRPAMIVLIIMMVDIGHVDHWLPGVYNTVVVGYLVTSLVWLAVTFRDPIASWAGWASTVVDVLAVVTLCLSSGGATAWLLPVFFLLPISVAFQDRPWLTAVLGALTALAYLGVWVVYSKRDDTVGLPNIVYMHFAFLLWFAAATSALSLVISRRDARVRALVDVQRRLVSESLRVEERNNRDVAVALHDGPLQELLAARLRLDELAERIDDPALQTVRGTLGDAATQLRSTLRTLHPAVLSELGLTPAVAELLRAYRQDGPLTVEGELDEVGKPPGQDLLYRAARELLANAVQHAHARTARVTLHRVGDAVELTVSDDGVGFDPDVLASGVTEGRIGLASLITRVEAMGGELELTTAPGLGTRVRVSIPRSAD